MGLERDTSGSAGRDRPHSGGAVRTGLFEGVGRCPACQRASLERFELPTQSQVGDRNAAVWPCHCGAEVEGSAQCLAISTSAPGEH